MQRTTTPARAAHERGDTEEGAKRRSAGAVKRRIPGAPYRKTREMTVMTR